MNERSMFAFLVYLSFIVSLASLTPIDSSVSLVASSSAQSESGSLRNTDASTLSHAKIYKIEITSSITNRFSRTSVVSRVRNVANTAQEITFSVVIPDTAFISGFVMEINGKNYTADVKEKDQAAHIYKQAVASGLAAAHVTTRNSNDFTVSVNVEPEAKAVFYLTYEELLKRKNGKYEQIINIYPKQPVEDLNVEVIISESKKITDLKTPPIRSGNEIINDNLELDPRADLEVINETTAIVKFSPNLERQKQIAHLLGTNEKEGFAGQFVVQYDVERDPKGGEVFVQDGYFVHFFAPSDLEPLPKHIVFVLDRSASMQGQKIEQLIDSMLKILDELHENDLFSIITFSSYVTVLNLDNMDSNTLYPSIAKKIDGYCAWSLTDMHYDSLNKYKFPKAYLANKENIDKAKDIVRRVGASGGTDILSALSVGLHLIKLEKGTKHDNIDRQSIIMFLSDGDPTIRITYTEDIATRITKLNAGPEKTPIFTLSFGEDADRKFLQKLAFDNSGFLRHIYEAADASLQLQDFYQQISSPLLTNVAFKYEPSVTSLTKTQFPIHFDGSELVVAGWYGTQDTFKPAVDGHGIHGSTEFEPTVYHVVSHTERLWAYITIKQLLENENAIYDSKIRKKAIDLALKYSFVTPVSSLVVVKPNDTVVFDTDTLQGTLEHITQMPIVRTTPFCSELYPIPTEKPDLLTELPWINDILEDNGIINVSKGKYKLGLNETLAESEDCPKTPFNTPGKCRLLHSCSTVFSQLTSASDLDTHFCVLKNEFAGICCPETD
ncbi:hypothetical protein ILUMI_07190 [Ignelater luminosus]|uniref:Inter-alpha-trypsin inhibitor heavy chain H4-like n=1 Tax=Ignelater luminosus TaxID=2038154 RepID=A0A8K0D3X1_IGNLU|nr:hypothetical protein ILUMI_07190 [Ignelater luminosus]